MNLSTNHKLILGFLLVSLITLVVGGIAYMGLSKSLETG